MVAIGNRNGIKEKKGNFRFSKKELSVTTDAYNNRLFFLLPSQSTHLIFCLMFVVEICPNKNQILSFLFFSYS